MDSPEAAKITPSTGLDSPPVQDSPFFNFISNLSPIKPVKSSAHAVQELSGLSSPPIVFKTPRTKLPNETNVLRRSQSPQLSIAEASQNVDRGEDCVDGSIDAEQFTTLCQSGLIDETQKNGDVVDFSNSPPSSSSGCVDEFLADPGVDCVNFADKATPTPKQSKNASESSQSDSSGPKDTIPDLEDRNDVARDAGMEQAGGNIQGEPKFDAESVGIEKEQRDGDWSYECLNIETSLLLGLEEDCQNSGAQLQGIKRGCQNDCESTFQSSAEPVHVHAYEDHSEAVGEFTDALAENIMLHDQQGSDNQRVVLRRCLQFEEAPRHSTGYNDSPLKLANTVKSLKLSTSGTGLEHFKSHDVELKETSERHMVNLPQSTAPSLNPQSSEKAPMVSKPLGIGLHLNSIVNATSVACTATSGKKSTDQYMGVQGTKSGTTSKNIKSCSMSLVAVDSDSVSNEDRIAVTKAKIFPSSVTNEFQHTTEDNCAAQDENGKSNSHDADNFEEHDQQSPRKKRKKTTSTGGGDGCKRCNCKKTKCLKLYCDCFAAGIYCTDPCSCQGCFNRPEHEKTVIDTREQIESRNPLAFAPKIVQRIPELPPNHGEDVNRSTPSSARHKRGCNCKKSMCLKKYCECYQANVGCSSGCRCEGCKNVYGRKEEHAAVDHGVTRQMVGNRAFKENLESTFDKEFGIVETRRDLSCAESINSHNLTPLTPSFQYSDHGKDAPKSRFLSRRYLPSPDSNLSILSSSEKTKSPPRDSEKSDVLLEANEELLDEGSWQVDYNVGIVESTSSRPDPVPRVPHLTLHPDTPMPMISLTSFQGRDCRKLSHNQLFPRSEHLSSNCMHRHNSPLTPMTRLCGVTQSRQGLDSGRVQFVDILEDETPVKVSSPNKKRISPPHSHIFELGSSSSGKLKSGRKFILKSVPSFPPLTPCIDSKGSTCENTDKLQDNSGISQNETANS